MWSLGGLYIDVNGYETEAWAFEIQLHKGQRTLPQATCDSASYCDAFSSRQSPDGCTNCPFACRSQDLSFTSYPLLILHVLAATGC